jgi:carboxymethylenebutenolidase
MRGRDLAFDVNGKPANGYLALPEGSSGPGVMVLHAWWGLNSIFKNLCDRLAAEGFVAFAPDLNEGRVATTIEEAKQIIEELDSGRKQAVASAAVDFMRGRPEVRKESLALIGFSMGAAWSLALAEGYPADIHKAVLFYGAGEADYTKVKAEILGHFSDTDDWEDIDFVRGMEADMRKAGLNTTFHIYSGLPHWFFEENRPEYNPEAAARAWQRTLEFLRK